MVDLFSVGKTPKEQCSDLKKELIQSVKSSVKLREKSLKIYIGQHDAEGNPANIGNNVLVVTDPNTTKKPFESADDKKVYKILQEFRIDNFFYTYYFWYKKPTNVSIQDIKNFSYWIKRLSEIFQSKMIICMGEKAQFSFLKKKAILRDLHGQQIGDYDNTPIFTTYPISYFGERSEFEDRSFKNFIKNKDWNALAKVYKEKIK